jgi:hypothetical protein
MRARRRGSQVNFIEDPPKVRARGLAVQNPDLSTGTEFWDTLKEYWFPISGGVVLMWTGFKVAFGFGKSHQQIQSRLELIEQELRELNRFLKSGHGCKHFYPLGRADDDMD